MKWCEEDYESACFHITSTASGKNQEEEFDLEEPWALPESQAKLLQSELGLENFSVKEIVEFVRLISDAPRNANEGEDEDEDDDNGDDDDDE